MTVRITPLTDPDGGRLAWLAAAEDGRPLGTAFLRLAPAGGSAELDLQVHPAERRAGVGTRLLETAAAAAAAQGARSLRTDALREGSEGDHFCAARGLRPVLALTFTRLPLNDLQPSDGTDHPAVADGGDNVVGDHLPEGSAVGAGRPVGGDGDGQPVVGDAGGQPVVDGGVGQTLLDDGGGQHAFGERGGHAVLGGPGVGEAVPGYRIVYWEGVVPDALAETFARSRRAMDDMPMDGVDYVPDEWDVGRVRGIAEAVVRRGEILCTAAALAADGEIVGFTEIVVPGDGRGDGQHYGTGVLPEHRGRGLARLLKVESISRVRSRFPSLSGLLADTADSNAAMRHLNDTLGYRPTHRSFMYQLDIAGSA